MQILIHNDVLLSFTVKKQQQASEISICLVVGKFSYSINNTL